MRYISRRRQFTPCLVISRGDETAATASARQQHPTVFWRLHMDDENHDSKSCSDGTAVSMCDRSSPHLRAGCTLQLGSGDLADSVSTRRFGAKMLDIKIHLRSRCANRCAREKLSRNIGKVTFRRLNILLFGI